MNAEGNCLPPRHPPRGPLQGSTDFQHFSQPSHARGHAAIHPRSDSGSPDTPSFTVDDVKAYISTATEPELIPAYGAELTIETVMFITSKEATELMRGSGFGLADDALVCFVLLRGPFYVPGISYAPGRLRNPAATAPRIGEVFDAHTGNLLAWAVLG